MVDKAMSVQSVPMVHWVESVHAAYGVPREAKAVRARKEPLAFRAPKERVEKTIPWVLSG